MKIANFNDFLKLESASGIILVCSAILAMVIANTPLASYYDLLIQLPVEIRVGALEIAKPLLLWINDGLMAVFFFLVGLELKRELLEGELRQKENIILPALGALGGMAVPALIYVWISQGDSTALQGWAIPTATDIAFALGVLSLLGNRVPISLKVLLVSLAIFDDIGAIIVIALFYTQKISALSLLIAAACIIALFMLNKRGAEKISYYLLVGLIMWVAVLKSGVHATLAGVVLALFIPMRYANNSDKSPVKELEHDLHGVVAFVVLPVFAFANSGISLQGVGMDAMLHPVPLGIAAGLFIGKQLGVFAFCWLGIKAGLTSLPAGMNWKILYGAAVITGIGFTMSLFIGSLAFGDNAGNLAFDERLGILIGSLVSAFWGYFILHRYLPKK